MENLSRSELENLVIKYRDDNYHHMTLLARYINVFGSVTAYEEKMLKPSYSGCAASLIIVFFICPISLLTSMIFTSYVKSLIVMLVMGIISYGIMYWLFEKERKCIKI